MQVFRWGNSLAVRLPAAVAEVPGLKEATTSRSRSPSSGTTGSRSDSRRATMTFFNACVRCAAACRPTSSSTGRKPTNAAPDAANCHADAGRRWPIG